MKQKPRKQHEHMLDARMLRMSPDLNERIRKYQKKLFEDTGVETSFSTAVRSLIEKGLKAQVP